MRRWRHASTQPGVVPGPGAPLSAWMSAVAHITCSSGGPIGAIARRGLAESLRWPGGPRECAATVFPLPLPGAGRRPRRGRARLRHQRRSGRRPWLDALVSLLNSLYGGDVRMCTTRLPPSRAQSRMLNVLDQQLRSFLRDQVLVSGEVEMKEFLQSDGAAYGGIVARPLGLRAGVPPRAADVDLEKWLWITHPELAAQVQSPQALLLPEADRPTNLPRPFSRLGKDYTELVMKNVQVGLQDLAEDEGVARHCGRLVRGSAFAVAKAGDPDEDRMISGVVQTNALLDPRRLPRPRYAYPPRLRSTTARAGVRLRISKRDARHYFHRLRLSPQWRPWLAHPPVWLRGKRMWPRHCTAAMGLAPSAGWAQALTDQVTEAASLPQAQKVVIHEPAPRGLPVWGSIIDDVWVIDSAEHGVGRSWCERVQEEWELRGVEAHAKKIVNEVENEEIQGVFVHGSEHWVGVSVAKRAQLMQGLLRILQQRRPAVAVVDRVVGKLGFAASFRVPTRCVLQATYRWLTQHRGRCRRAPLWPLVAHELLCSLLLVPLQQFSLSQPWSQRVEASDASPGGHGRAWTQMPADLVQDLSRLSDHKGAYTHMGLAYGIEVDGSEVCPLHRVHWPVPQFHWHTAARPGG